MNFPYNAVKMYSHYCQIITQKNLLQLIQNLHQLGVCNLNGTLNFRNVDLVKTLLPYKEGVLDTFSLQYLKSVYYFLYPNLNGQKVLPFYDHYGHVTLAGDLIGSYQMLGHLQLLACERNDTTRQIKSRPYFLRHK